VSLRGHTRPADIAPAGRVLSLRGPSRMGPSPFGGPSHPGPSLQATRQARKHRDERQSCG